MRLAERLNLLAPLLAISILKAAYIIATSQLSFYVIETDIIVNIVS